MHCFCLPEVHSSGSGVAVANFTHPQRFWEERLIPSILISKSEDLIIESSEYYLKRVSMLLPAP